MAGYPNGFLRLFWWITGLALLSGLLLIPGVMEMKLQLSMPWRLEAGHRLWVAALHLLTALGVICILGAIWAVHMLRGWRAKRNRFTGVFLVSLFAILILSAIGIYYFGDEVASNWASLIHTVFGVVIGLAVWLHILVGLRETPS